MTLADSADGLNKRGVLSSRDFRDQLQAIPPLGQMLLSNKMFVEYSTTTKL
jgi:hypothetical protein